MNRSPEFLMWSAGTGYDYMMITASGTDVYAAWAQQTVTNQWDVYAAHINVCPTCAGPNR